MAYFSNEAVGSCYNNWHMPVTKFGPGEEGYSRLLRSNPYVGDFEIRTSEWQTSCDTVDEITKCFWDKMDKIASRRFPELSFEKFVKQGSSREGLKIRHPNEFDMILPFTIKGINLQSVPCNEQGPALVYLKVLNNQHDVEKRCPNLVKEEVFTFTGSKCFVNAEDFQTHVITSIMDQTVDEIQKSLDGRTTNYQSRGYKLSKASVYPPTYRFQIKITGEDGLYYGRDAFRSFQSQGSQLVSESRVWNATDKVIEFDIVPGFHISRDHLPNPDSDHGTVPCDRYVVMKWIYKKSYADMYLCPNLLWRESVSGYEKHILDVCRRNDSQIYILTACRILKACFDNRSASMHPPIGTILSSYHLKNIAIHCILLLTIPRNEMELTGVREALGYFLSFLEITLAEKCLPHYFYGNPWIAMMFPALEYDGNKKRLNLYQRIPEDSLSQAKYSLREMMGNLRDLFTDFHRLRYQVSIECFRDLCINT